MRVLKTNDGSWSGPDLKQGSGPWKEVVERWCFVGLGNPGPRYQWTRHNFGFLAVDRLARRWGISLVRDSLKPFIWGEGIWGGRQVVLAKPLTYMNWSGTAVQALLQRMGFGPGQLLVLHDEMDLPLGRLKFRERGGDGGHRGIRSIISSLGTDRFLRLRIGIGRPSHGMDAAYYVLSPFEEEECTLVDQVLDRVVEALQTFLQEGLQRAMNRYHTASEKTQLDE